MLPLFFESDLFGLLDRPIGVHTYGFMLATGFLLALILSARQAKREDEDPDAMVDMAFYALIAGLVGARVVFIITKLDEYIANPIEILKFWKGGVVFYGAFIGAAVMVYFYCRKRRLNYLKIADIMVPNLALAHAFGRLGCIAAGCCFGSPTEMPWGVVYPAGSIPHHAQQAFGLIDFADAALPIHPTQLYEAGAELAMFWVLVSLRQYKRFHGQLFLLWLGIYPVIRSVIEMFRGDVERGVFWGLSTSQWISLMLLVSAAALYGYARRQVTQSTEPTLANAEAASS